MTALPPRDDSLDGADTDVDVLVVGAFGIDAIAFLPPRTALPGADPATAVGSLPDSTIAEVCLTVSHAGSYASRGYAALGLGVAALGHVGDDPFGRWVLDTLAADGVATTGVVISGETGRGVNLMLPDGTRHSLHDPRVAGVTPPDETISRGLVSRARMLHVNIPDWARGVIPLARELGVPVMVDVQDVHGPDDEYRADFVAGADILFASGAHLRDPEAYARWAMGVGPARIVVIGMGSRGCLVVPRDSAATTYPPVELPPDPSGRPRPVVDTNGAGDSLAVGFATSFVLEGRPLAESVRRGQLCARWCCTVRGTSAGLLSRADLERWAAP